MKKKKSIGFPHLNCGFGQINAKKLKEKHERMRKESSFSECQPDLNIEEFHRVLSNEFDHVLREHLSEDEYVRFRRACAELERVGRIISAQLKERA